MHTPKSIEQVVEEQARRWQFACGSARERSVGQPGGSLGPVIAISRQHGARGGEVARAVADRLGCAFYDREILSRIAAEAHVAEGVVAPLDEKDERTWLSDWLAPIVTWGHLSPYEYAHHLMRVVGTIACSGNAVILGRGVHLMVRPGRALRVMVVAPLPVRIATVAAREGTSEVEARRRVAEVEQERRAYLARCFRVELEDPALFDLRVNTGVLGVTGAVSAVSAAAEALAQAQRRDLLARST